MGARCYVCQHPDRARIELALARRTGLAQLQRETGISKPAMSRHRKNHMAPQLKAALLATGRPTEIDLEALRKSESEGLLQTLVTLRGRLYRQLDEAEEKGDLRAASSIDGRILDTLNFGAKLLGELSTHSATTINQLVVSPEYLTLRAALIRALMPYPEARKAVALVLRDLEGAMPHITGSPLQRVDGQ